MNRADQSTIPAGRIGIFCDWGIISSLCALVFILPASIAILDSFALAAVLFYFLKKINRIIVDWPSKASTLNLPGKIYFIFKGFAPPASCLNLPLQFLALAFFISVLFSHYPTLSLEAFFGKFVKCVFLYFSFIEAFSNERRLWIFLNCFFLSAFITALSGVVQHYTGKDFLKGCLIGTENNSPTGRISSCFFGANGFGAYLLPVIALVSQCLFTAAVRFKSWIWTAVLGLYLILLLTCLCWTYSRSAWIGFLGILLVMILLDWRKLVLAGALFLVFVLFFMPSLVSVRHLHLINDSNQAIGQKEDLSPQTLLEEGGSGRNIYWKEAVSIIRRSPVWGTGLNTYIRMVKRDDLNPQKWMYAHNCYLQLTAETGLLGLASFLWLSFVLFRHGFGCCQQIKGAWPLTLLQGALCGLFGFLVQSFFDNTFYTVQLGVLMWLLFGLIGALTRLNLHN